MHNAIRLNLLVAVLLTSPSVLFAQVATPKATTTVNTAQGTTKKINLLQPLEKMAMGLNALKTTADPDLDYAAAANVHAQSTQELMKAIAQTHRDSALTQTAIAMAAKLKTDQETINMIQRSLKPTRKNTLFANEQQRAIAAITRKVHQSVSEPKLANDFTKNTYILMRDQRQDALNLATNYLKFGKDIALRNYAQEAVAKANLDLDIIKRLQSTIRPR